MNVFDSGVWPMLKELADPELLRLAKKLPTTVLQSRALSSCKKYIGGFRRWKAWAEEHSLAVFPANEHCVALYLQHLGEKLESKSAVEEAVNALNWVHSLAGVQSPIHSPLVQTTAEGLRRLLARPVQKKAPMSVDILSEIVENAEARPSLSNIRLAAVCLLAFSGFLRCDELLQLRSCDVKIAEEMMTVKIQRSKTDQLRQGDEVLIARTTNSTCPVSMMERYMRMAGIDQRSEAYLFRAISKSKYGEKLRASGRITYSTLRELFKRKLVELGHSPDRFGLHSLRAGGATAAANAGVQDRLFKRHGRWRSEGAKDGYVEDSTEKRLFVSQQLGLYPFVCQIVCMWYVLCSTLFCSI